MPFCTSCLNENSFIGENTLPSECQVCGSVGTVITKERKVSGWLGIQLFFHSKLRVDIVRNGRIIEQFNKEIFYFEPANNSMMKNHSSCLEMEKVPDTFYSGLKEYPIDNAPIGGRIVGELYVDFIKQLSKVY